jgi:hypothetical protein
VLGSACQPADLAALSTGIETYAAKSIQSTANALLRDVVAACRRDASKPNPAPAVAYTEQLLAWWRPASGAPPVWSGTAEQFQGYLIRLFRAVGHTIDEDLNVFGTQGFIGVCRANDDCVLKASALTSGIKIFKGALSADPTAKFLVTGRPAACGTLDGATDVRIWGQCVEITVEPKDGPSFPLRAVAPVPALVQTCLTERAFASARFYLTVDVTDPTTSVKTPVPIPVELPDATTSRLRLAQQSGGSNTPVKLRPRPSASATHGYDSDRFFTAHCEGAELAQALLPAHRPFEVATRWFGEARSFAAGLFTARTAYAAHGGLGSLGVIEEFSTFGPADPFVFEATFDNPYGAAATKHVADAPGVQPVNDDVGRANWSIDPQLPGYVLVRAAPFGGFAAGTNVVEVNQAGGAAESKKGLTMYAQLAHFSDATSGAGQNANAGTYRIRWTSSVASPRAGGSGAPFVATSIDAAGSTTELARFVYVNGPSAQTGLIRFGDHTVAGLTWQQNVPRRYEILVDLTGGKAYLRARNPTTGAFEYLKNLAGGYAMQSFAAGSSLTHVGWRLGLRDNQVLAIDDLEVVRLADTFPPPPPLAP